MKPCARACHGDSTSRMAVNRSKTKSAEKRKSHRTGRTQKHSAVTINEHEHCFTVSFTPHRRRRRRRRSPTGEPWTKIVRNESTPVLIYTHDVIISHRIRWAGSGEQNSRDVMCENVSFTGRSTGIYPVRL